MVGMVIGSLVTWFGQGKYRDRARQTAAESRRWHTEADRQKAKADDLANQLVKSA